MTCFQSTNSLQQFANEFWTLSRVHNSAIFNATWSKTMEDVYHRDMTVSDVGPKVWEPAFTQCQQLLEKLNSGSMTLSDVDKHFSQYKGELQRLERELKSLFCGVNVCCREDRDPSKLLRRIELGTGLTFGTGFKIMGQWQKKCHGVRVMRTVRKKRVQEKRRRKWNKEAHLLRM